MTQVVLTSYREPMLKAAYSSKTPLDLCTERDLVIASRTQDFPLVDK